MLNWDEEVKPSSQKPLDGGLQGHRQDVLPSASFQSPAPQSAAASAPAQHRRVNAADKRIINGQTDVNQLVPFKYKWAWESTWPPAPTTGCRRK